MSESRRLQAAREDYREWWRRVEEAQRSLEWAQEGCGKAAVALLKAQQEEAKDGAYE